MEKARKRSKVKSKTETNAEAVALVKQPKLITEAQFKKLTPAERRVLVAKDVLAALKAGRLSAQRGTYLSIDKWDEYGNSAACEPYRKSVDARSEFAKFDQCGVCARGACVIAAIERFDRVSVGGMGRYSTLSDLASDSKIIGDVFPVSMMLSMESLFEAGWLSPNDALVVIMKNIIANHGQLDRGACRDSLQKMDDARK